MSLSEDEFWSCGLLKLDCAVLSDWTLSEHNNGLEFKGLSSNDKVGLADAVLP